MEHDTVEQLLSPKALAALLGLAEQTIYNRHSLGGDLPPAIKLGRALRFRPADVVAWLGCVDIHASQMMAAARATKEAKRSASLS